MENIKETAKDKAIASEPGENVKEFIEEEGTEFDDKVKTPKTMTEDTSHGDR